MGDEREQLREEMDAIDAIYPDYLQKLAPLIYKFKIPQHEHVTVQMSFPQEYPEEKPHILDVISEREDYNDEYLIDLFQEVLDSIFHEGDVCVFDLFTELDAVLFTGDEDLDEQNEEDYWVAEDNYAAAAATASATASSDDNDDEEEEEEIGKLTQQVNLVKIDDQDYTNYTYDEEKEKAKAQKAKETKNSNSEVTIDPLKGWTISDPITDRKSTFVAFTRRVTSLDEAYYYLDLLKTDKKISKSSHNMTAWRIKDGDSGVQYQDCDDDGETAAGGRLLHLLTLMDVWDVMVVVSRWFGGVHIGPDRFRHINSTARDAVVKAGFKAEGTGKKSNKKKK